MDGLTLTIQKCNLQLKLDNHTEGYGNCFPNAIVQQCRRHEIKAWLQENRPDAIVNNHLTLRAKVANFAMKSRHKTIHTYKTNYEKILLREDKKSWRDYWNEMGHEGTWVDSVFVQVTAWYMGLDIQILTTSATPKNPFILVTGNITNTQVSSAGPSLLLGNYTNVHYQSLLPLKMNVQYRPQTNLARTSGEKKEKIDIAETDDFIYMHNGEKVIFPTVEREKLQCPSCGKLFQRPVSHINSKTCNIANLNIDMKEFTNQLHSFREGFRLEKGRKRQQSWRVKVRAEKGSQVIKEEQNKCKLKSQAKLKELKGSQVIKEEQNKRKL
jgi:hypothetical protein